MAKRFGRNQKRKMQQQVERAQSAALHAQDRAFDAQRKLFDLQSRAVIIDVEAIEGWRQREIELRASIHARGRESLHYAYQHDPKQSVMAMDRDSLHAAIARHVASALVDAVERGKFARRA